MKRIDAPFHVNNRFVDGNAQTGTRGTRVDSSFLNALQEEMAHVIERAGFALDPNDSTQLAAAISRTTGRYYPTLAEARADIGTKLEAGNVVSLGGYAEPGDGGATVAAVHAAPQSYFPGGGEIAPVSDDVTLAMFGGSAEGVGVGYDDGIGRVDGGDNPVTDNRPAAEAALTFLRKVHGGGRLRIPATAASWGASGPFLIPSNVTVEGPGTFENWISQSLELNFWWQMGASLGNLYAFGNGEGLHDAFPARTCPAHPAGTTTLGPLDVSGIGIGDVLAIESKARRTRTVDGVTSDTLYARYCDFAIVLGVGADSLAIDRPLQQALTGGGDIRLCTTDEDDARTTVFNSLTVPLAGRRLYLARNAHSHGVFYRLMNGLTGDERGIGLHWACFESSVIGNRFEFGQGAANGNPFGYSRFENNTCRSQRVAVESAYYTIGSTCIGNRIDVVEGALPVTGLALPVRWGGEDWGLGNVVRDNRARWLRPEVSGNTGAMEIAGEEALVEANLVEAGVMNTAISFQSASQTGRGNSVRGATQYAIRAAAGSTLQEGNRIAPGNRTASFYAGTGTGLFTKNFLGGGAIAVEDYNAFFAGTLQVGGNFEGQMLNDYTLNDDRTQIAAGVTGTIHGVGFAETEVNRPCEIAIDVLVDIEAGQGDGIKNFPLRINGTTVATVKYPDGTTGVSRLSARVTELGRQDKVYTLQLTGAVNEYKQGTFTSANTPSGNSVTLLGAATGTGNIAYERLEVRTVTPDIIPV